MGIKLFDEYSLLHFAVGIIAFYWNISIIWTLIVHIIFEFCENTVIGMKFINNWITMWPGGKDHPDSFINMVGDTISAGLGWIFAYLVNN